MYETIKIMCDYCIDSKSAREMIKKAKPLNSKKLKLFEQFDEDDEFIYDELRVKYEMANFRINQVAFFYDEDYDDDELYNLMNDDEKKAFDILPNCFICYRGYSTVKKFDIDLAYEAQSWTVKKSVAKKFIDYHNFSENINMNSYLIEKVVFKSEVAFVLLARDEAEIVLKLQ